MSATLANAVAVVPSMNIVFPVACNQKRYGFRMYIYTVDYINSTLLSVVYKKKVPNLLCDLLSFAVIVAVVDYYLDMSGIIFIRNCFMYFSSYAINIKCDV